MVPSEFFISTEETPDISKRSPTSWAASLISEFCIFAGIGKGIMMGRTVSANGIAGLSKEKNIIKNKLGIKCVDATYIFDYST
jgi:hypothetical protein